MPLCLMHAPDVCAQEESNDVSTAAVDGGQGSIGAVLPHPTTAGGDASAGCGPKTLSMGTVASTSCTSPETDVPECTIRSPLSPCPHVESEEAPLWPQHMSSSRRGGGAAQSHPRIAWGCLRHPSQDGTDRLVHAGVGGGSVVGPRHAGGGRNVRGGRAGGGPVAEASEGGSQGDPVRPQRFFEGDSLMSDSSEERTSARDLPPRGSGMTLEELMHADRRLAAVGGRTLVAQRSVDAGMEQHSLDPQDYPPLVAVKGNVDLLDNDATVCAA